MLEYHPVTTNDAGFLYMLLEERPDYANISHQDMPEWIDHLKFISSEPYKRWLIATNKDRPVGAAYVTHNGEIGIAIRKEDKKKGYGREIVQHFIYNHDIKYANIAPANIASQKLFEGLGFRLIQFVYKLEN